MHTQQRAEVATLGVCEPRDMPEILVATLIAFVRADPRGS